MKLDKAQAIADEMLGELSVRFKRIEIAGSVRRKRPEVKDIELVGIRDYSMLIHLNDWLHRYHIVKGKASGKYVQFIYVNDNWEEITVDLFFAEADNWGNIFAIRTGSAEFSHKVLARGWVKAGYKSKDGYLRDRNGKAIPICEEQDLFDLIGIDWIKPERREL